MKALEILKNAKTFGFTQKEIIVGNNELLEAIDELKPIETRIAELELIIKGKDVIIEAMAQGKGCANCKFCEYVMIGDYKSKECDRFPNLNIDEVDDSFYCNFSEPKENQDVK